MHSLICEFTVYSRNKTLLKAYLIQQAILDNVRSNKTLLHTSYKKKLIQKYCEFTICSILWPDKFLKFYHYV